MVDSIPGKYIFKIFIGGGFASDASGKCYAIEPDATIEHSILIDSALNIVKIIDTTDNNFLTHNSLFECDTLYFGKVKIVNDTLIATYDKRPICPFFNVKITLSGDEENSQKEEEIPRYEELDTPLIEKYSLRNFGKPFFSIIRIDESNDYWTQEFRKSEPTDF